MAGFPAMATATITLKDLSRHLDTWYTSACMDISLANVRIDRTAFRVFSSFEEAEAADRAYWHSRTPAERLTAVELMRQSAYGYDPATARLQRVFEVAQLKER